MPPKKVAAKKLEATSAVETTTVASGTGGRRKVTFQPATTEEPKPLTTKKAAAVPAGIVTAKSTTAAKKLPVKRSRENQTSKKKKTEEDEEEEEDESPDDESSSDSDDDLSDLAGDSDSDDSDDDGPRKKPKKEGEIRYTVLQLRYLPKEFQEPELYKFLGQFGARVTNCFCVRSKKTFESKGTAYVQFDNEGVLPIVVEECDGMVLGGRTVRARAREMHRPMPTKQNIRIRRLQGARHQAHGPKLSRHDVSKKSIVAQLIRYSRAEKKNNEALKSLGIDYESNGFNEQRARIPASLLLTKEGVKKERAAAAAVIADAAAQIAAKSAARKKHAKTSAAAARQPAKTGIVEPKKK